jgi:hypothetical protein
VKVQIRAGEPLLTPAEQAYAERAALMSLGRFGSRVSLVSISVAAVDDGRFPGVVERQVAIRIDGACRLVVPERAAAFELALLRALDRARRTLERDAERFGRRRGQAGGPARVSGPVVTASSRRPRARASIAEEDNVQ